MTSPDETARRADLVRIGRRLYGRGLSPGTSGNLSCRLEDGTILMTPMNTCLGELLPHELSHLGEGGDVLGGPSPSKEVFLHTAYYATRAEAQAIVHLHSTATVALSCLDGLDPRRVLEPITPYAVMRIGVLPLVAYHRPGDDRVREHIRQLGQDHGAVLLANHGPVVAAGDLAEAAAIAEELEEAARLALITADRSRRLLSEAEILELVEVFGARWI